jgi:glycosyltransferase involved in cell wall biosynthesis
VYKPIKIVRITTVPISLKVLLTGQLDFMYNKGFEVTAISADGKEIKEISKSGKIPHLIFPLTRKITPLTDLYCLLKLFFYFIKHKPDIVHSHTPKAGLIGMLAAKLAGVPLKIHTIAGLPMMTAKGWRKKILIATEKLTYKAADEVLPNSKSMYNYLLDENLIEASKLKIISEGSSNGFDDERFNPEKILSGKIDEVKRMIEFDTKNFYLLFVGRMVIDKGLVELIESFLYLQSSYPNLKLLLLGEYEDDLSNIPEHIKWQIKTNSNIFHLGWRSDVEIFLSIANVLIHPSHREGFPNIVLQAAAMKCPILCSKIPGNIDIISSNQVGYLFAPQDKKSLINTFENFISDIELATMKAEKLQAYVWQNYPRRKVHEKIYKYYLTKLQEVELGQTSFSFQES